MAVPLYLESLAELTVAELSRAMRWLADNHEGFFPTPAQIRKAAGRRLETDQLTGTGWASKCGSCGCELSWPESRKAGQCLTCRGALSA